MTPEHAAMLHAKVCSDPSENAAAFMRDHQPMDDGKMAVACLIEDGQLFYDERTKMLSKLNTTPH